MTTIEENPSLVFWGAGTVRTLRPIWIAEELGLSYHLEPIGPRTGETKTSDYTAMNPKQKVPYCQDGDFGLSESVAICRYLVKKYGNVTTLRAPQTLQQEAKQDEWVSFIYGELDETSLYVMRRHGGLPEIYGEAPTAMKAAEEYVIRQLAVVEQGLGENHYLIEGQFGLADVFLTSCLSWAKAYEIPLPSSLEAYRDRIIQRPGYRRAVEQNSNKRK